jgi:uncharacterized protein
LRKWLQFDPFADEECRSCVALPVCMVGCAHHAMDPIQYENRCSTFRYTYREQIDMLIEREARGELTSSSPAKRPALDTR